MKTGECAAINVRGTTDAKGVPVVREEFWHEIEEMVVVIAKDDCLEGNLS